MQTVVIVAGSSRAGVWRSHLDAAALTAFELRRASDVGDPAYAHADVVLLSPSDGSTSGALELLRNIKSHSPETAVILLADQSSEETILAAWRSGAADFVRYPCRPADLVASIRRVASAAPVHRGTQRRHAVPDVAVPFVGDSPAMRHVRDYAPRVATTDVSVLITGETGVGKECVAELIHGHSARRHHPCVAINCAAIPESLIESELFGFERGAFTGAEARREGALKTADGGTVFFDEIGDMGLSGQAKILRAIETREVHRLGGRNRVPLNVRVIAATNQDLERLTAEGRFRKDLYYRLNVVRIHLPPLRERKEDLEPLLDYYIRYFNRRFNRDVEGFTADAIDHLRRHHWPGNIRELRNLVEAVFVNLNGRRIAYVDLPEPFRSSLDQGRALPTDERERLLSALFATRWNKSRAAQELHWSRMTLYRKLAKYHVSRSDEH